MTRLKRVTPSASYSIRLPAESLEDYDGRVGSFWADGHSLLLQLSSYLRAEGQQLSAGDRLRERIAMNAADCKVWGERLYPDASVDQATAECVDENDVRWIHTYLVWPHLTIYALVSGGAVELADPSNWAMVAIKSIELTVQ